MLLLIVVVIVVLVVEWLRVLAEHRYILLQFIAHLDGFAAGGICQFKRLMLRQTRWIVEVAAFFTSRHEILLVLDLDSVFPCLVRATRLNRLELDIVRRLSVQLKRRARQIFGEVSRQIQRLMHVIIFLCESLAQERAVSLDLIERLVLHVLIVIVGVAVNVVQVVEEQGTRSLVTLESLLLRDHFIFALDHFVGVETCLSCNDLLLEARLNHGFVRGALHGGVKRFVVA